MPSDDQGSVYIEGKYYVAALDMGMRNGRRKRARRYVRLPDTTGLSARQAERAMKEAERAAEAKLEELRRERDGGLPVDLKRQTVAQFLDVWLRDVVAMRRRQKTHRTYSDQVRLHISPALGHLRVDQVQAPHIQAMLNEMARKGLRPSTIDQTLRVLHTALEHARVFWKVIAENPAAFVEGPAVTRTPRTTLDPEGARELIREAVHDRLGAMLVLAVTTGIRKSELRGLRWDAIDLEAKVAVIREQLVREERVYDADHELAGQRYWTDVFQSRKGDAPVLPVALSDLAVDALQRRWQIAQFEERQAGDRWRGKEWNLVFCREDGSPLPERAFNSWLDRLLNACTTCGAQPRANHEGHEYAARMPHMRWHDLRHTTATMLARGGVMPAVVRDALGHSTIAVTMDVYTEQLPDAQRAVADTMDALLTDGPSDDDLDVGSTSG